MSETRTHWTEDNSELYRQIAQVVVPDRAEQMAALLTLLPFARDDAFRVVELASGEGRLAWAIARAFPNASVLALDVSESMREATASRLREFGPRASVGHFNLAEPDWYPLLDGADAVVSSLCVHHLDGGQKQMLFHNVARRLSPRGALLIADLVLPQRAEARELFGATYDRIAEAQSVEQTGSRAIYERFVQIGWNYYRHPDEFDKPSPLFDQLLWLRDAGFAVVDCFWLRAGHAIYGGYMARGGDNAGLAFADALAIAREALT